MHSMHCRRQPSPPATAFRLPGRPSCDSGHVPEADSPPDAVPPVPGRGGNGARIWPAPTGHPAPTATVHGALGGFVLRSTEASPRTRGSPTHATFTAQPHLAPPPGPAGRRDGGDGRRPRPCSARCRCAGLDRQRYVADVHAPDMADTPPPEPGPDGLGAVTLVADYLKQASRCPRPRPHRPGRPGAYARTCRPSPSTEPGVQRGPRTVPLRHVLPGGPGTELPHEPIEHGAVVQPLPTPQRLGQQRRTNSPSVSDSS